jgi:predicted phage-related endonuclease
MTNSNENQSVALDHLASVIAEHKALGVQADAIKARREELAAEIKAAIGDAVVGTVGGVEVVTVPFRTNSNIDAKIVLDVAPAVHALALRVTPYRPVLHKKAKKK